MDREETKRALRIKALSHVKYAERSLALWETLTAAYDQVPIDVKEAFLKVKSFLIDKEMHAYRSLLLLISIMGDDESQEATRMAFKRFLSADMSIMHFWSHNGEIPGSWLDKDERLLRELFKEIERDISGKRKYSKKPEPKVKPVENKPAPAPKKQAKAVESKPKKKK